MKKRTILPFTIIVVMIFSLVPPAIGQVPEPPCWFRGTVTIDGLPAQDNQNVTAKIRGTNLEWTTKTTNGTYGGSNSFYIPYDNSTNPSKDGGENGDTIEFYMNGVKTNQTAIYQSFEIIRTDLVIGSPGPIDLTPPHISILSPENKTYSQGTIPLTLTVNETTTWIGYSLDSQANQTLSGNGTLSDLSIGSHNITVYAKDYAENTGSSERILFRIEAKEEEPFPAWVIATVIFGALFSITLLILLFREHSRKMRQNSNK